TGNHTAERALQRDAPHAPPVVHQLIDFGSASDITAEAADAVVLELALGKIDELMHIGRRMRRIALQSALGGMIASIVGMIFAAGGYLQPIGGAIGQELIDLFAVLNAV